MKFKSFIKFILALGVIFLGLYFSAEKILTPLGSYLFVDEQVEQVDAVVSGEVTDKVIGLYKNKKVKKIFLLIREDSDTWKELRKVDKEKKLKKKIRQAGLPEKDILIFRAELKSALEMVRSLKDYFVKNNIHSALILLPGYQTRKYRFYLDRYLSDSRIATFVQSLNTDGPPSLEGWWKNTVLANYFLDQYLEMGYFYFHKILWLSDV